MCLVMSRLVRRACTNPFRFPFPEQSHVGFSRPWQFTIAFKSANLRANWFRNEALTTAQIRTRITPKIDGTSPLRIFDGATQTSIMYPSRANEAVFCRRAEAECEGGHGFDPEIPNLSIHSSVGEMKDGGDSAAGNLVTPDETFEKLVHRVCLDPECYSIMTGKEKPYDQLLARTLSAAGHVSELKFKVGAANKNVDQ